MRIVTLLLLTALINGTFLTGCAGLRGQAPCTLSTNHFKSEN